MMAVINSDKSQSEVIPQPQASRGQQRMREIERQMPPNGGQRQNGANDDVIREGVGIESLEDEGNDKEINREEAQDDAPETVQPGAESGKRYRQDIIGTTENLPSSGDPIKRRQNDDDGVIRFGFQNVRSIDQPRPFILQQEIVTVGDLGINICGFAETNRPWTARNKHIFDEQMRREFNNQANTQYASVPAEHGTTYQPGGVLQMITGSVVGRMSESGVDKYGRYAWHALRGSRDEGIVVITAYRVSQESLSQAGPNTNK